MQILQILEVIIVMLGIVLIYDARYITKKRFSISDQNVATKTLKFIGFIIAIIGGLLIILF